MIASHGCAHCPWCGIPWPPTVAFVLCPQCGRQTRFERDDPIDEYEAELLRHLADREQRLVDWLEDLWNQS